MDGISAVSLEETMLVIGLSIMYISVDTGAGAGKQSKGLSFSAVWPWRGIKHIKPIDTMIPPFPSLGLDSMLHPSDTVFNHSNAYVWLTRFDHSNGANCRQSR